MRKLTILLLLTALGPTIHAQTRVTVSQVEQLLATLHHHSDAKAASQLSGLELTERATSATLERWKTDLPGNRTRETLTALADASAFLNLPAADLRADAPPEIRAQEQIFSRTANYVGKTLHKLPNFSALRTTTYFELVTPQQLLQQQESQVSMLSDAKLSVRLLGPVNPAEPKGTNLYVAGTWNVLATYRDGLEVTDVPAGKGRHAQPQATGLSTAGEFGPVLYVVLEDALHGKVTWGHWERGTNGLLAVFHYEVTRENSHYAVRSFAGGPAEFPSYHGEIAVDPASGTIFRITVEASRLAADSTTESSILVEYGPVAIGGIAYICPVRAVALSKRPTLSANGSGVTASAPIQTCVNDVSFTQYHVFRSDARILPGNAAGP
jgi:hypothetical protein